MLVCVDLQSWTFTDCFPPTVTFISRFFQVSLRHTFSLSFHKTCHYFQSVRTLLLCTCHLFWIQLCHEMPLTAKLKVLAGRVTLWEIAFGQSLAKSPSPVCPPVPQLTASAKKIKALTSIWLLSRKVEESCYCHIFFFIVGVCMFILFHFLFLANV